MYKFRKSRTARVVATVVGLTAGMFMMFGVATSAHAALSSAQIDSIISLLESFGADAATVSNVRATLNGQPTSGGSTSGGSTTTACNFTRSLTMESEGADVVCLQDYLTSTGHFTFSGGSTGYFGSVTRTAVAAWQAANGVSPAVGYFGPVSQAKYSEVAGTSTGNTGNNGGGTTTPAPGTGLTVSAGSHPANTLAPASAARVPFTRVNFTAGNDGAVTVTGVTVKRTGIAADSSFSGVVLLDSNGTQLGVAKTLNSDHQATLSEPFTVPAGQTRTMTIAANMSGSVNNGEVASFDVVSVNTSATVSGALPIRGASHTINSTLSIGAVTVQRGNLDPGSSQTKEVGTTGYTFSSVRVTAGSAEKVWLHSIRWNQTGSAAASDLSNVMTYVDGVAYPATVSSDGKYYTSTFGSGILIDKGFSKDISVKGDITDGSNRTVDFDIAKRADLAVSGELYGYGLMPPYGSDSSGTDDSAFHTTEDPWYDASQVTVSAGTLTVSADNTVAPAQNIAINLADQVIGGYSVDVRGESVSVAQIVFNVMATGNEVSDLTNVTLVDQNGAVLAGPVDGADTTDPAGTLTFTDTVTFPVGVTRMTLKGKLGTDFANNDSVQASTTPSTQWTTVTGQTTGNSLTAAPASAITSASMTVKAGALAISQSSQPTARTVIAGAQDFEFARYVFDATSSGEDLRVTSFPAKLSYSTNVATYLTGCQLWDGSTAVTTGSNIVNPASSHSTGEDITFTFDGTGITVPKGTAKTLSLTCDVSTSATSGSFTFGNDDNASSYSAASGVSSGTTITETWSTSSGQAMTSATGGSYTVSADTSILYTIAQAGTTGVTLAALRFEAGTAEDVQIKQLALALGNTASNSPTDLVDQKVTLWHDGVKVGEANFVGTNADNATTTLSTPVTVEAGEFETITIKGDLAGQNANSASGAFGAFLEVNYDGDNNGLNGNYGTGVASGTTISPSSSDTDTNGLRVFRSVPTVEDVTTSTTLAAGSDLYKIKITAGTGRDIGLRRLQFDVATTGATTTGFQLFGPSGAVNSSAAEAAGVTGSQVVSIAFDNTNVDRRIPAGGSKTFALRASSISGLSAANTETLNVNLRADSAYPSLAENMGTVSTVEAGSVDNFVWTPFSTTTPTQTAAMNSNLDWTNGYGVPGYPSVGQDFAVRVFSH